MRLGGRVAIITGAARGMGLAYARRFADEGARVVMADVDRERLEMSAAELAAAGADVVAVPADVADVASVRAMVDAAVDWGGTLDILVNNAGIGILRPLLEHTEEDFDRHIAVNLRGTFFALQAAARVMVGNGSGKIINIASTSGFVSSATPESAYDVSKAGVRQLTISAAVELAPHGINVNGIAPGTIATDMSRNVIATPERRAAAEAKIPLGRLGVPDDLTGAAVFLASSDSDYLCGHTIVVDGGWLLL